MNSWSSLAPREVVLIKDKWQKYKQGAREVTCENDNHQYEWQSK